MLLCEDIPLKNTVEKAAVTARSWSLTAFFWCRLRRNRDIFLGILGIGDSSYPDVQQRLLAVYGEQVTTALHNTILHMLLHINNRKLSLTYDRLEGKVICRLWRPPSAGDAKDDPYTRGHPDRFPCMRKDSRKGPEWKNHRKNVSGVPDCCMILERWGYLMPFFCKDDKLTEEEFAASGDILKSGRRSSCG